MPVLADITQTRNMVNITAPKSTRYQYRGRRSVAARKAIAVHANATITQTSRTVRAGACHTGHCQCPSGSVNANWAIAVDGVNTQKASAAATVSVPRMVGTKTSTSPPVPPAPEDEVSASACRTVAVTRSSTAERWRRSRLTMESAAEA